MGRLGRLKTNFYAGVGGSVHTMTSSPRGISPRLHMHAHIHTPAPVVAATSLQPPFPAPILYAELLRQDP